MASVRIQQLIDKGQFQPASKGPALARAEPVTDVFCAFVRVDLGKETKTAG